MNEKEKIQEGFVCNPSIDKKLFAQRLKCKNLCHKYNKTYPEMMGNRQGIIIKLLGKTNGLFFIEQPFHCDYGYNIEIGANFYANHNLVILDTARVIFGNNVFIGPNCGFYTTNHPILAKQRNKGLEYAYPILVGDNVWIGGNVSVMPGVKIGDNTVIGAGSVVTKNIPDNVVAAGNPCKVLKHINQN